MDSQKSIIFKVQKILFDEVCEREIVSACIPINVIFSEVLTSLNIPHTVNVGYSNFKPYSCEEPPKAAYSNSTLQII
jgi:hypothetical protein